MKRMNRLELKEHERKTWAAVAEGWRRRDKLLRKGSAPVTERMLDMAGIDAGHWMLDIPRVQASPLSRPHNELVIAVGLLVPIL